MFGYSEKKLAKEIARVAKSIDPSLLAEYISDAREVRLKSQAEDAKDPVSIYLGNLFLKLENMSKKERLNSIDAFLRDVLTPPDLSPDEVIDSFALRVRTDFDISFRNSHFTQMGHTPPSSVLYRRGDLLVEIVSDSEESVATISPEDLAELDVTQEEAIRIAGAKLRRYTDAEQWQELEESIWLSSYQDDYDVARLMAADDNVVLPINGTPIVFAPSHSVCLVTDAINAGTLARMIEIGNEAAQSHRPFSQLLWSTRDGRNWEAWQPEANTDAVDVVDLQTMRELAGQYEETKDLLERALGEDVFVASYQAMESAEGLVSYFAYTFDLPTYFPHTDFVALVDPERSGDDTVVGRVSWDEFATVLGPEFEDVQDVTPRWVRVSAGLNSEQKKKLSELARPL